MWRLVIVLLGCIGLTTIAAAQQSGQQDAYCNASPQDVSEVRGLLVTLGYETETVDAGCGPLMQEAIRAFWSGVGRAPSAAISPDNASSALAVGSGISVRGVPYAWNAVAGSPTWRGRTCLAGIPTMVTPAGTSFSTTALAPMRAFSPTVTGPSTWAPMKRARCVGRCARGFGSHP